MPEVSHPPTERQACHPALDCGSGYVSSQEGVLEMSLLHMCWMGISCGLCCREHISLLAIQDRGVRHLSTCSSSHCVIACD
jgi:hypothetical protein